MWPVAARSQATTPEGSRVFGFFARLRELSDGTATVEVHDLLASNDNGVAIITETATRQGRTQSVQAVHVLHLSNGKVTEFWDAHSDQYTSDEFWALSPSASDVPACSPARPPCRPAFG